MDESITITKAQLRAALQQWEQDHRDGKCMDPAEAAALTTEQHAEYSSESLWLALGGNPPASIPRSEMTGEQLRAAYEASAGA
jgi:hypothetical protein